jgi:hypothetical protein
MLVIEVIYNLHGRLEQTAFSSYEAYHIWLENMEPERLAGDFELLEIIESEL